MASRPELTTRTGAKAWDTIWKWTWFTKEQWQGQFRKHKEGTRRTLGSLLGKLGAKPAERDRHVLTFRVRKLLMNQNLELSLFAFYSPSDSDAYLRPRVSYKIDDHWKVEIGGNLFLGAERHTFFGQFANNTNIYAALRYAF